MDLNRVATVNDVEVTKQLVRMGIGCSLVSCCRRRRSSPAQVLAHPLSCLKHAEREIYLVTNRSAHLSEDLDAFVKAAEIQRLGAGRKNKVLVKLSKQVCSFLLTSIDKLNGVPQIILYHITAGVGVLAFGPAPVTSERRFPMQAVLRNRLKLRSKAPI